MAKFRVYGIKGCPWCVKAVDLIRATKSNFDYITVSDEHKKDFLDERNLVDGDTSRTFPRVYKQSGDGALTLIGGYDKLEEHFLFG